MTDLAGALRELDGLESNRLNQLIVRNTLQTTRDDDVFALGDCCSVPWKDGKTANDSLAWSLKTGGSYMPTPLVYGDYLYVLSNGGMLACYEAKTGKKKYNERVGGSGGYTASPVAADGRIYCVGETDGVRVVKAGPEYELLAVNPVGETCMATPAIGDGVLFLRTEKHLVALGLPKSK